MSTLEEDFGEAFERAMKSCLVKSPGTGFYSRDYAIEILMKLGFSKEESEDYVATLPTIDEALEKEIK